MKDSRSTNVQDMKDRRFTNPHAWPWKKNGKGGSGGGRSASSPKQHEHSYSHMYCHRLNLYTYVCDQKDMKGSGFTNAYAWP